MNEGEAISFPVKVYAFPGTYYCYAETSSAVL